MYTYIYIYTHLNLNPNTYIHIYIYIYIHTGDHVDFQGGEGFQGRLQARRLRDRRRREAEALI